jgi:hypothetical protein
MKLKMKDDTSAEVRNGKPVYTDENGREIEFDYSATVGTISRLNGEAKGHRERAEAAEEKLKGFEGIDDPEKARKALETIANLDSGKLKDAAEIERVKNEAKAAFDEQLKATVKKYEPVVQERDSLRNQLHQEHIGNAFGKSKFIVEKLAVPVDLAQAKFGGNFSIKDGKIVAKDGSGNPIYSKARPGEIAEFDEALEILVDSYPYRDNILKGTGASGGGASGSNTGAGGKRTVTRAAFDQMAPAEQAKAAKEATIVD